MATVTIASCPKSFSDPHIATIQRNAIRSWLSITPTPRVILLGNESGVRKTADEMGIECAECSTTEEKGVPRVDSIFGKIVSVAETHLVLYINTDIMLLGDCENVLNWASERVGRFLVVGRRWDVDVDKELSFNEGARETHKMTLSSKGGWHAYTGIDYFLFPKNLFDRIPPFLLGRTVWDNWLVYEAWHRGGTLIDATEMFFAVHQNHSYRQSGYGSAEELWNSEDAKCNMKLAEGNRFHIGDCGYRLTPQGLNPVLEDGNVWYRTERLHKYRPWLWRMLMHPKLRIRLCRCFPNL